MMILFSAINSVNEYNEKIFKRKSGNVNSLSHALQVKEFGKDNNEQQEKNDDKKNIIEFSKDPKLRNEMNHLLLNYRDILIQSQIMKEKKQKMFSVKEQ